MLRGVVCHDMLCWCGVCCGVTLCDMVCRVVPMWGSVHRVVLWRVGWCVFVCVVLHCLCRYALDVCHAMLCCVVSYREGMICIAVWCVVSYRVVL